MDGQLQEFETGERFDTLPFAEQFMVWAMRMWVDSLKSDQDHLLLLAEGFVKANVAYGLNAFDRLMWVLAAGAASTIDIRCPNCAFVSPDEQRMLAVLADAQGADEDNDPSALLSDILTPSGLRFAGTHVEELARALTDSGMLLRPRVMQEAGAQTSLNQLMQPRIVH